MRPVSAQEHKVSDVPSGSRLVMPLGSYCPLATVRMVERMRFLTSLASSLLAMAFVGRCCPEFQTEMPSVSQAISMLVTMR